MRRYPVEAATLHAPGKNFTLSLWARGVGINGSTPTLRFGAPYYDFYPWSTPTVCPAGEDCYTSSAVVTLTDEWVFYSVVVDLHIRLTAIHRGCSCSWRVRAKRW